MDSLMPTLNSSTSMWMVIGLIGLTCATLAWGVLRVSQSYSDPLRRRLRALQSAGTGSASGSGPPGVLSTVTPLLQPRDSRARETLKKQLIQAGIRSPAAMALIYVCKFLLVLGLPLLVLFLAQNFPHPKLTIPVIAVMALLAAGIGIIVPDRYVQARRSARQQRLMQGFPDALDLLVVCTEAGLGLNAAIERVAEQLPASNPELGLELSQVNAEIRAGLDRSAALRSLAERTGLEEIRGLVSLISHSMRFGTGIAITLRVYAEDLRDRRLQKAEEMAAMIGTKLIFPLCFCIFPAFFLVATGPAIVGVLNVLADTQAFSE